MNDKPPYIVGTARYAKGMHAVHVNPSGTGLKTRADYLLTALKCRWSNRERSFIVSPSKLRKFEQLFADGWDGDVLGRLVPPSTKHRE